MESIIYFENALNKLLLIETWTNYLMQSFAFI